MIRASIGDTLTQSTAAPRLYTQLLDSLDDIRAAQQLRYATFCEEYGVTLPVNGTWNGQPIDIDDFDDACMHVAVRETLTGDIVGYTRVLSSDNTGKTGGFYSAHEFRMEAITSIEGRFLEIGRTCIRKDYRNGATIAVLWGRVAQLLIEGGYTHLFGCASISLTDGGANYISVMSELRQKHLSPEALRVEPLLPIPVTNVEGINPALPPLLKAYTRMGAKICGEACWDPEFNCADVFVLLDTAALSGRYARHFLRASEAS